MMSTSNMHNQLLPEQNKQPRINMLAASYKCMNATSHDNALNKPICLLHFIDRVHPLAIFRGKNDFHAWHFFSKALQNRNMEADKEIVAKNVDYQNFHVCCLVA